MKRRRNKNYLILEVCSLLIVMLIGSCDTIGKREKLVNELKNHFQKNRETYNLLNKYFSTPSSYYGFTIDYKEDKIILKQEGAPIKIDSINQVINNTVVYDILNFMKMKDIRDISGNKEWIKISFRRFKTPCFGFWFRDNFNLTDEEVIEKIKNFKNKKSKNWLYILDDKWFIKGEACF